MIIVKKSGYLKYNNSKFRCALGEAGIGRKLKEGDKITPEGIFKIIKVYYRPDRIKKIITNFKTIKIKKNISDKDVRFKSHHFGDTFITMIVHLARILNIMLLEGVLIIKII